jgi:sterol 24-C-methyltransferase
MHIQSAARPRPRPTHPGSALPKPSPIQSRRPRIFQLLRRFARRDTAHGAAREYLALHAEPAEARAAHYEKLVNRYYDLATDFYEYGWGPSFHFAPRFKDESLAASLVRHEHYLALRLGLRPGMRVGDIGCGVGGPAREIARTTGAHICGVNNNVYQVERARTLTHQARLSASCEFVHADFMNLPMADGELDAAYAIESACHAPEKRALFVEVYRALAPGAWFAGYDWCLTDRYDERDEVQRAIRHDIEQGGGVPALMPCRSLAEALGAAGFEQIECRDLGPCGDPETPWFLPLTGRLSLAGFRHSRAGGWLTHQALHVLETAHVVPRGATAVSRVLRTGADALVRGGRAGIFTPAFFFLARKSVRT